ncbi:diguanylate cyclase, partial [Herbaspirillum sp. HC18]
RAIDLYRYQARKSGVTAEAAKRWQARYQIGAKIQAAAIGIWCGTTLLATDDAVAHMIALSVTTGIAAGGAGRAYGRPSIFHLQAVLIFAPAVLALAWRGTPYYIAMAVVSAAFLLAIMRLSVNLHRIFMGAVVAREREA